MNLLKPFLIIVKSLFFYLFDSLALSNVKFSSKNQLKLILIIRQDAIGDFVIWLDTAKEYRKLYPPDKYKIVLVGNKIWCDLAEELPYWDKVISVDVKQFKSFSRYRRNILQQVRSLGAQIAVQPTFSREFYNGDSLVRASNALHKVSSIGDMSNRNKLKKWLANRWHTELIPASQEHISELERNAEFFSYISGKTYLSKFPKLYLPNNKLPQNHGGNKFYVLVPGASTDMKKWPVLFFSTLAEKIYQNTGWSGIICGTKKEHPLGVQILKLSKAPLKNMSGKTELVELSELLNQSQLIITNDTGAAHISSALGTSTVCILGGGHFGRFIPYPDLPGQASNIKAVFHKMQCYGCNWECVYTYNDGEPAPCISNVSVDAVWQEVEKIIKTRVS
jgi:ADP-heptose:LPS heptosyltransferase